MKLVRWISEWWETWQVWRSLDPTGRVILKGRHNPDDFVEVGPPGSY